jgi:hypothetical protein
MFDDDYSTPDQEAEWQRQYSHLKLKPIPWKPTRRPFQYCLEIAAIVTVVAALVMAWWMR